MSQTDQLAGKGRVVAVSRASVWIFLVLAGAFYNATISDYEEASKLFMIALAAMGFSSKLDRQAEAIKVTISDLENIRDAGRRYTLYRDKSATTTRTVPITA